MLPFNSKVEKFTFLNHKSVKKKNICTSKKFDSCMLESHLEVAEDYTY